MSDSSFAKYVRRAGFKTQDVYFESNDAGRIGDLIRPLGAKRIFVICSSSNMKFKAVRDVTAKLKDEGYAAFVYSRLTDRCSSSDVVSAFKQFWDYNCNTVISIGDDEDCNLAKLISALAACQGKELKDIRGINKISGELPILCHIPMDNGIAGTTAYARYLDEETGKVEYVYSACIVPGIVIVDTDLSLHIPMSESFDSSLCSLAMALDIYTDREGIRYPEYRADAENACLMFVANLEKMKSNPGDSFLRRNISVAALYAGLSTRCFGAGVSNLALDITRASKGSMSGASCLSVATSMIESESKSNMHSLSTLAKAAYLCPSTTDDISGATTFIEYLKRLCYKSRPEDRPDRIDPEEAARTAEEIRRITGDTFGRKISSSDIAGILVSSTGGRNDPA